MNFFDLIFTSVFLICIFGAGIVIGALGTKNPTVVKYVKGKINERKN